MPLVSVIIPAYNAEAWVGQALESLLTQTHVDWEAIVVDDGSADDTAKQVLSIKDQRIKLVQQKNRGASAARNRGFQESSGPLIQYLDADDLLDSEKIASQIKHFQTGSRTLLSGAWAHFQTNIKEANFQPEAVWCDAEPVAWLVSSLNGGGMMHPAAWLSPRELIEAAGPWDESLSLHDDGEFFARVMLQSDSIKHVSKARVYYRSIGQSLSRRRSIQAAQSALTVCHSKSQHLLKKEDSPSVRRALACGFAQVAYEFSQTYPEIAQEALQNFKQLAPKTRPRLGGKLFRHMTQTFGFPLALKIRKIYSR